METREQPDSLNERPKDTPEVPPSAGDESSPLETGADPGWKPAPPRTKAAVSADITAEETKEPLGKVAPKSGTESVPSPNISPSKLKASVAARRPLLADEPVIPKDVSKDLPKTAETPPVRSQTSYMVANNPRANTARKSSPGLWQIYGVVLVCNLLLLTAGGLWLYKRITRDLEQKFGVATSPANIPVAVPVASPEVAGPTHEEFAKLQQQFKSQTDDMQAQLLAAQKRLAEAERQTARLQQIASYTPDAKPSPNTAAVAPVPVLEGSLSPAQNELILLKERNRLTSYADEAIATGERRPYDLLWKALDDPKLATLTHAARSEILRVQNYYLSGTRLERFDIPVADYFPESAALRDNQLSDDQLITLLSKIENPWQVRLKAANLLGLRRATKVGDALVDTIKADPNLDVVKEATFSFEQISGYRAKLFEATSLETWWKQYNTTPPPPPVRKTAPSKSVDPKPEDDKKAAAATPKAETPKTKETDNAKPANGESKLPEMKVPEERN